MDSGIEAPSVWVIGVESIDESVNGRIGPGFTTHGIDGDLKFIAGPRQPMLRMRVAQNTPQGRRTKPYLCFIASLMFRV